MIYRVCSNETNDGYAVCVPELPGCWSQGNDEKEAIENIIDAIYSYIDTTENILNAKCKRFPPSRRSIRHAAGMTNRKSFCF